MISLGNDSCLIPAFSNKLNSVCLNLLLYYFHFLFLYILLYSLFVVLCLLDALFLFYFFLKLTVWIPWYVFFPFFHSGSFRSLHSRLIKKTVFVGPLD